MSISTANGFDREVREHPRDGWYGVAWEPAVECVYCGHRVSEPTGLLVREAKKAHRASCYQPAPPDPPKPRHCL